MDFDRKKDANVSLLEVVNDSPQELDFEVLVGRQFLEEKAISSWKVQKLGLALAGFSHYIHRGRFQLFGQSEQSFLNALEPEQRSSSINNVNFERITCILVTKNLEVSSQLLESAEKAGVPVLRTGLTSSDAIKEVTEFVAKRLAPETVIHGVMIGIFELGLLITGDSGVGKSECALDLVTRGHRLIADDSVIVRRQGEILEGRAPDLISEQLEIRGLGIINVREVFGVSSVGKERQIDLAIHLKRRKETSEDDRLGLDMQEHQIMGLRIPKFDLPVTAGRNIATIVETAVRVFLLKTEGRDSTKKLIEKHDAAVSGSR